jgi:membrane-associated phospholipid phosphatase
LNAYAGVVLSGHSAALANTARMIEPTDSARSAPATTMLAVLVSFFVASGIVAHVAAAGTAADHAVLAWMVAHRHPQLTSSAIAVTTLGSPSGVAILAVVAAAMSWWRMKTARPAILILMTVAAAGAVSTLTKVVVGAHRPPHAVQLITETDPSFPSGHVTGTLALLGAVAVVVRHHARPAASMLMTAMAAVVSAVVALTRLYLGVHWLTDVVGGLLLGATATVLAHLMYRRMMDTSDIDDRGTPAGTRPSAATGA